jgi:hypothetical protein
MPNYIAKEGETLADIALRECGLVNLDAIVADEKNKGLFATRPDRVLHADDLVVLPELESGSKTEKLEPDVINEFETDRPDANFRLTLLDHARKPRAGLPYKLLLDDGREITGQTTGEGKIEAGIPYGETTLTLVVGKVHRTLLIGGLKSGFSVEGIQARLNNLGYEAGLVDGNAGDATVAAIRRFEKDNQLKETGEFSEAVWNKVREVYGE